MQIDLLTDADVDEAIAFIQEGTATSWPRQSWLGSQITGLVIRDASRMVGLLPLRPRKVLIAGVAATAYYCTAVRIAPSYRGRGLGSELLAVAKLKFCGSDSFVCVVRSDRNGAAYKWYERNGFVVFAEISSHDLLYVNELKSDTSPGISVTGLHDMTSSLSNAIDEVLNSSISRNEVIGLDRSVGGWRRELGAHYYSQNYSHAEIFRCWKESGSLVGLIAYTEMQSEARFDVLDFEYENSETFRELSEMVVRHFSTKYVIPIRWNLGTSEGQLLGIDSTWRERWRTYLMVLALPGLKQIRSEPLKSVGWRYRQIEFV